ncbi:zinc metallopeptidase [Cesiribacter andamanensis]|uniref:Putative neutral zinc metallopeptidase n=1 Tax=Cesiribacter andamanensis AMV16 TaxID=1279009 RepID=M7NQ50_9BACT|nr:zinc metallopeptidase [Cesiribacter andamanensis]EMR03840.1 Putative neutral zinc metallopeptidase [Cesiribacter andamanensis AMV16]
MAFDGTGLLIFAVFAILSWLVGQRLRSKFAKYSQIPLRSGISGAEAAAKMLQDAGITNVRIVSVAGRLTDHYNPADRTVNLSQEVYQGRNAAAVAVAAHEVGHAVQHAKAYSMLKFRSAMVPVLSVSSQYLSWVILIGIFLINTTPVPLMLGIGLFAITTLFAFVTLPVEFDASRRALAWMGTTGLVDQREMGMSKDALKWAAMTYVVAALASLAQLLYLVMILMGGRRD